MIRPSYLLLIVAMAVVTYATRVGFFGFARQFEMHPLLRRALEYVPVSILAALVFPSIVAPNGQVQQPLGNVYFWSAAITAAALLITRRGWLAILLGVTSMIVFRGMGI